MIHKLWIHRIDRLCHEVPPTSRIDIPAWTIGEFFTEYLSDKGWLNLIIGEIYINGSIKFIRLPEIWVSGLPFIENPRAPEATRGWWITGSTIITESWGRSAHTIPDNSTRSPVCSCTVQIRIRDYLLYCRRLKLLWRLHNSRTIEQGRTIVGNNLWFRWRRQNIDIFVKHPDSPATQ